MTHSGDVEDDSEYLLRRDSECAARLKEIGLKPSTSETRAQFLELWQSEAETRRKRFDDMSAESRVDFEDPFYKQKMQDRLTNLHDWADIMPKGYKPPKGFYLKPEGVFQYGPADKGGEKRDNDIQITYSPVWVESITKDLSGENEGILLTWIREDGSLRSKIVPCGDLHKERSGLIEDLANSGLRIVVGESNKLRKYLGGCRPEKRVRVTSTTGWVSDNIFVLPSGSVLGTHPSGEVVKLLVSDEVGIQSQGLHSEWKENVSELCAGNSRLVFALSVSFAATLLNPLGIEGGGFNYRGHSSLGKTTIAKVAGSVWGGPGYLTSMRSTANGFEGTAVKHNHLPFIADEANQANPKEIGSIIYMLGNGVGKSRADTSGNARVIKKWLLLFILTGELSIDRYLKDAGERVMAGHDVRCIDLPANTGKFGAFENLHGLTGPRAGADFSNQIVKASSEYFGTAGPAFVNSVISFGVDKLRIEYRHFEKDFLAGLVLPDASGQVARVGQRMALIAFAGELASRWAITNLPEGEATGAAHVLFRAWLENRGGQGDLEKRNLLYQVQAFFEKNQHSRFDIRVIDNGEVADPKENVTRHNMAGWRIADDFYVLPSVFSDELIQGFDRKFALEILVQKGILKSKDTIRKRFSSSRQQDRVYHFHKVFSDLFID